MAIKDEATVERYAMQHAQMIAMIDNLKEFIDSMPAPNEHHEIANVNYGYTGDVARIHESLQAASDLAYELTNENT